MDVAGSSILWSKVILTIWSKPSCSHLFLSMRRTAYAWHKLSTPLQCNLCASGRDGKISVETKRIWIYTSSNFKP